ncbi:MAG: hypothetical protein KKB62_00275 [Nanoarchaeota archaeon]|nr:hypothetical protein [Nanoarchaeota archaeon]
MKTKRGVMVFLIMSFAVLLSFQMVSAGVGIKWDQESALIPENSDVCLTYGVYNPWPTDTSVQISLSSSLQEIIESQETEVVDVPKYTYSNSSIPIKFCFKTPKVYGKDCLLFGSLLCSQECSEPMKVYEGQVIVSEASSSQTGGSGSGSSTSMSVSAPLRVRVQCVPHSTDYSPVYIAMGVLALLVLAWRIKKRKAKSSGGKKSKKK